MKYQASTAQEYIDALPENRKPAFRELRKVIRKNIPKGFKEVFGYGMPGYAVPHSLYPAGYHCEPRQPLPFMGMASQKHFIAVYHMGVYADPKLLKWFTGEYAKLGIGKLDMGKSCIRFKNPDMIPFKLIGELAGKISVKEWIAVYEKKFKR